MDVSSFIGALTGGNNVKIDIRILPPGGAGGTTTTATTTANNMIDPTKAVLMDHYPSWKLHKNPFWRVKHPGGNHLLAPSTNTNTTASTQQAVNPYNPSSNIYGHSQQQQQQAYPSPYGVGSSSSILNSDIPDIMDEFGNLRGGSNTGKELIYAFEASQDVEGIVILRLPPGTTKGIDHLGIKVQFIGRIDMGIGISEGKPRYDFINLSKELVPPGTIYQMETILSFKFKNMDKEFESYRGRNVSVRYIIRVSMERKFLPTIRSEKDIWVQLLQPDPIVHEPIKMEVGIEDCLHIEFEYDRKQYHLEDMIRGKIHFLLVRIKIKHMELAVIRRETSGEGVAAAAVATATSGGGGGTLPTNIVDTTNTNTNIYTETQTLVKYEIMDGGPIRGEIIPVKLSLRGIPADLTPTYMAINNRFSVRYYLNLVLVDEDDRRYFKQQEIILYRRQLG